MPDYNIHIHLPGDETHVVKTPSKRDSTVENVLRVVQRCSDWRSLYALAPELPRIGLAIIETANRHKILCRLHDNKPLLERVIDDFIFLGSSSNQHDTISPRHSELIMMFITENYGAPQKLQLSGKRNSFRVNPILYGKPIFNESEDVDTQTLLEYQLIDQISRSID